MQSLDKKAVWYFTISYYLYFLISFVFFIPLLFMGPWVIISLLVLERKLTTATLLEPWTFASSPITLIVLFIFAHGWAVLVQHFYKYEITDDGFRKEYGVIYKKYVTIPYTRIQNIDIHRGIVERFLGLSTIRIQTAGAGGVARAEGTLPGLSEMVAIELRDELIARAKAEKGSGM